MSMGMCVYTVSCYHITCNGYVYAYCVILYCNTSCCIVMRFIVLYCIVLQCTALVYAALSCQLDLLEPEPEHLEQPKPGIDVLLISAPRSGSVWAHSFFPRRCRRGDAQVGRAFPRRYPRRGHRDQGRRRPCLQRLCC